MGNAGFSIFGAWSTQGTKRQDISALMCLPQVPQFLGSAILNRKSPYLKCLKVVVRSKLVQLSVSFR